MVNTSRELTSYLKGVAILTVVWSHFSIDFMPFKLPLFANHTIAFFFILSGFGLFFSLNKVQLTPNGLVGFYVSRFMRIYPLYWFVSIAVYAFDPDSSFGAGTILDFFLIHFTAPPRVWFLHALIPCYVFAPAVYSLVIKFKKSFLIALIVGMVGLDVASPLMGFPHVRCWVYRNIYFSQYFMFACGMLIAFWGRKIKADKVSLLLSTLLMLVSYLMTNYYPYFPDIPFNNSIVPSYLFVFSSVVFVALFVNSEGIYLPLKRIVCFIGSCSYSIYIFSGMYAFVLVKLGFMSGKSYLNILPFVIFFPGFILGCVYFEELFSCRFKPITAFTNAKLRMRFSEV